MKIMDETINFSAEINLKDLRGDIKNGLMKTTLLDQAGKESELERITDEVLLQLTERGNEAVYSALLKQAVSNGGELYNNQTLNYRSSVSN